MILRSPALILFVRLKDRISLYEAQDAVTEVFLTPPVDVVAVARSAAACLLETYDPSAAVADGETGAQLGSCHRREWSV